MGGKGSPIYDARIGLARALVPHVRDLEGLEVFALGGSVARGWVDDLSDLEVVTWCRVCPSRAQRDALIGALGAEVTRQYDRPDGLFAVDNLRIGGFQIDLLHETLGAVEDRVQRVSEQCDVSAKTQQKIANLPDTVAFIGADRVQGWKDRLHYTESYRRRAVEAHLPMLAPAGAVTHIWRGDVLRVRQLLQGWHELVVLVTCALNRRFFPGWGHLRHLLASCEIAPPDLYSRLVYAQTAPLEVSRQDAVVLLGEILDRVEAEVPGIDTTHQRQRLAAAPRPGWSVEEIEGVRRALGRR